jgi:hypothetical protein
MLFVQKKGFRILKLLRIVQSAMVGGGGGGGGKKKKLKNIKKKN